MSPDDCRSLLVLAETLHFSRAAAQLHMSASALSRGVQRIEQSLGHTLFIRDRRHVSLTRAGELVRDYARTQLASYELLLERLREEREAPSGEVRIACTVTACYSVLPDVLSHCRALYPELTLQLLTSDAVRASARLVSGEVDIAVLPLAERVEGGVAVKALTETALGFVARSDDPQVGAGPVSVQVLKRMPLVLPQSGLERERFEAFLRDEGLRPQVYAEVNGNEAILAMVSLGCGWGLVPSLVLQGSPLKGGLVAVPMERGPLGYTVGACTTQRALQRRAVAAVWSLL